MKKTLFTLLILLFSARSLIAYTLKKNTDKNHVIHIVKIDPKTHQPLLAKAKGQKIGRATVPELATQHKASIAINAGFFDIGGKRDGVPTGSLIIDGKVLGLKNFEQALFIKSHDKVEIKKANATELYEKDPRISLVSGIPLLIAEGKINQNINMKKSDYYTKPHARTAIGLTKRGEILLVVAEHHYLKDISTMTLGEAQSLLNAKNLNGNMSLKELKIFLKKEFTPKGGVKGLTIPELAQLMLDEGCVSALNLDGGGSSTLYVDGKVINKTFGDIDEAEGLEIARPVSDAILFKKIGAGP